MAGPFGTKLPDGSHTARPNDCTSRARGGERVVRATGARLMGFRQRPRRVLSQRASGRHPRSAREMVYYCLDQTPIIADKRSPRGPMNRCSCYLDTYICRDLDIRLRSGFVWTTAAVFMSVHRLSDTTAMLMRVPPFARDRSVNVHRYVRQPSTPLASDGLSVWRAIVRERTRGALFAQSSRSGRTRMRSSSRSLLQENLM